MRRFSNRNSLVTLSDINITPLLDLAFVLLIIFIITRPLLEQSMDLKLPPGGKPQSQVNPRDVRTVEVSAQGLYKLDRRFATIDRIETELVQAARSNPNLIVDVRVDENCPSKFLYAVVDRCLRNGIYKFRWLTRPDQP